MGIRMHRMKKCKTQYQIFMKIPPMGAEVSMRTHRHDEANSSFL